MAKTTEKKQTDTSTDQIERRTVGFGAAEIRLADGDKPKLDGYAAKYGVWTDILGFRERIKAGAFDESLKTSDPRGLKNHDPNLLLGRHSSGTLRLKSNTVGLRFEIDVPDTTTGRDTVEEVRRGDLSGCSFAFTVAEDDWKYFDDKPSERTIVRIGSLFDVGPVTYPAYEDTSVSVRALEMAKVRSEETADGPQDPPADDPVEDAEPGDAAQDAEPDDAPEQHPDGREHPPADDDSATDEISPERRREIAKEYRHMGRIIGRCRPAKD